MNNRYLYSVLFGGALLSAGCTTTHEMTALPNIVLVFTDDQGFCDIGCYGAEGISTPNLDALADSGIRFTDFHVASSVSSPSRAALLTGCYPKRVGINGVLFPERSWGKSPNRGLNPREETLAELLRERGYATAMAGKWHLGHRDEFLPRKQGFDRYLGLPYSNDMNMDRLPLICDDSVAEICPDQSTLTERYTRFSVDFIREKAQEGKPFFLYLAHSMPHIPIAPGKNFAGKSHRGKYGDVMEEIDWSVGEVVSELRRQGIYENTLIIFMSDNGPWLSYGNHAGDSGDLREGKFSFYEGGFRVPCIVSCPKMIPRGIVSDQQVTSIDILPTLCAVTGARLPHEKIDGINVEPVLRGEEMEILKHRPFFYHSEEEILGVRVGPWKYIDGYDAWWILDREGNDGQNGTYRKEHLPKSLYNLKDDVGEEHNLIGDYPDKAAELSAILDRFRSSIEAEKRPCGMLDSTDGK